MKEDDLLGWLVYQKRHSEIPEVTDEMKDKLIESEEFLAVIFCKTSSKTRFVWKIVKLIAINL